MAVPGPAGRWFAPWDRQGRAGRFAAGGLWWLVGLVLFVGGCAVVRPLPPEEEERVATAFFAAAQPPASCATLEATVAVAAERWWADRRFHGFLQAAAPASFRLVVLGPMGQPVLLAAFDGLRLAVADTTTATLRSGGLADVPALSPAMETGGLYGVLTGRPQPCPPLEPEVRRDNGDNYRLRYRCRPAGVIHDYRFDGRHIVAYRQVTAAGEELFRVTYHWHGPLEAAGGHCPVPDRLILEAGATTVALALTDIDLGRPLPPETFRLADLPGYTRKPLE